MQCRTGFKHPGFARPTADIMCKTMGVPAAACEPAGPFPAQLCSDIAAYDRAFNGGAPGPPPTTNEAVNEKLYTFFNGAFNTMTRGTWTGSEVDNYGDPASTGSGTSTVSTSRWAPGLVGLLVSETADATNSSNCSLLLGGEAPRVWLSAGETVGIFGAPVAGGRLDMTIDSSAASHRANITLPPGYACAVTLRVRSPGWPAKKITRATVGGQPVEAAAIDAAEETVSLPGGGALQSVVVAVG